jgi:hypothetical protein
MMEGIIMQQSRGRDLIFDREHNLLIQLNNK